MKKYEPGAFILNVKRSATGLGLFAGEVIPKGACIIEYIGRAIPSEEQYTSKSKYLFEVDSKITIDGTTRKNKARYVNHSCRPNADITIWKKRIFIMAKRTIKAGEEIAYDYGKEYWDEHIKPFGCRCVKCAQ